MISIRLQSRIACALIVASGLLTLHAAPVQAQKRTIQVEQTLWGFSGRVTRGQFHPFSVLISNPTSEPLEGKLRLQKSADGMRMLGTVLEADYYLSPFASRWVQFYPYTMRTWEEWKIWWGDGESEQMFAPKPQFGPAEPVLLVDGELLTASGVAAKRFPDELWPAAVSGTQGLLSVILDHVPNWEESRRQSFLDWLHAGGTVHLVRDSNGRFPQFPEGLSVLNLPADRRVIGDGIVVRHDAQLSTLDPGLLTSAVPGWVLTKTPTTPDPRFGVPTSNKYPLTNADTHMGWGGDGSIFSRLRSITRPRRNWILIYALSLGYLGMIFPGCYLVGRVQSDWRVVYAVLLGGVVFFSLLLSFVGRRSYSEPRLVRSVGLARPVANGGYDVMQWSDVAVADSGRFHLKHGGTGRVYSTCEEMSPIDGTITFGPESCLEVTIPPFSSQGFAHRVRYDGEPMELSIVEFLAVAGRIQDLVLLPGKGFPIDMTAFPDPEKLINKRQQTTPPPSRRSNFGMLSGRMHELTPLTLSPFEGDPQQVYVLYGDRIYRMRPEGGRLVLAGMAGSVSAIISQGSNFSVPYFDSEFDTQATPDEVFHMLCGQLINRSLDLFSDSPDVIVRFPTDRLRVFIYAPMPEELSLQSPGFDNQEGYLLYIHDLATPESL